MFIKIFPRIPKAHIPISSYLNRMVDLQEWYVLHWFFLPKHGFLQFIWIFSDKNHLKFNISHILSPNRRKEISLNPSRGDLSNNTKGTSQLLWNFLLWFNWIFSEKFIQYSRTSTPQIETIWNQADAPLLVESFPKTSRMQSEMPQFGRSHNEKQTKQTKFLHRKMACPFWQAWKARVKIWKCSIKFLKNQ